MTRPKKKPGKRTVETAQVKRRLVPPPEELAPPAFADIPEIDPPGCTQPGPVSETVAQTVELTPDQAADAIGEGKDVVLAKTPLERDVYIQVDRTPDLCPFCGCAERTEYQKVRTTEGPIRISGKVWDRVILRRTSCKDCGRKRVDRQLFPEGSVRRTVLED